MATTDDQRDAGRSAHIFPPDLAETTAGAHLKTGEFGWEDKEKTGGETKKAARRVRQP